MKRKWLILGVFGVTLLFLLFPGDVCHGAKEGLGLWFYSVLPALLPFMILSNFMIRMNITHVVTRHIAPIMKKIYHIPESCCYPVVIGMLTGYPMGARTTAQLYERGDYTREDAGYIMSFCNNASPMFLIEFMGAECLGLKQPIQLLVIVLFSAWVNTFFCKYRFSKGTCASNRTGAVRPEKSTTIPIMKALDESIIDGFLTITRVGGYIILFAILTEWAEQIQWIPILPKYLGISLLEITTGGTLFSKIPLEAWLKEGIFAGICAFGGISSVAQTASVLQGTDLSVKEYFIAKLRQAILATILGCAWFYLCCYF